MPLARALPGRLRPCLRLHHALCGRPRTTSSTWTPSATPGLRLGADALGGAGLGYWEPIAERYGLDIELLNGALRPHLRLHVRGQGRQDPHGLLLAPGHGRPRGPEGPLRHRLRQRPGLRPPRHRLPQRRPDEPQPLPGRGHPVPVPDPHRLAQGRRHRQDPGEQRHDRPGRRGPGPPGGGGAGGLQVVRARASWTAPSASAARRAPAPPSCAGTARCGPPTRTASSWACWPPRSPPPPARTPAGTTRS